tara:strand:- start:22 stop:426 length:405 start_codon:yes stop_codon:yes gene_type:complete
MHPRQYKATISLKKAIIKFLEKGFLVFENCSEQGPIDIVVVNPANGRTHFFDIKTSNGTRYVDGKAVGGAGHKLKPNQKELGVRLCLVEGEEVRIVEKREEIQRENKKGKFKKSRKGIDILEEHQRDYSEHSLD